MRLIGDLYEIFWFYTQLWLKPEDRRPYTYIFRDLYHRSPLVVITLGAIGFYLLGRYTTSVSIVVLLSIVVALFVGIIMGHLWWGKKYIEGQQEYPTYLGENDE